MANSLSLRSASQVTTSEKPSLASPAQSLCHMLLFCLLHVTSSTSHALFTSLARVDGLAPILQYKNYRQAGLLLPESLAPEWCLVGAQAFVTCLTDWYLCDIPPPLGTPVGLCHSLTLELLSILATPGQGWPSWLCRALAKPNCL